MTSQSHYNEEYFNWQSHVGKFGAAANKIKFERLIKQNEKVLDFGCGAGEMLIGLRNRPNFTLWGCDLESDLVDWCSSNLNAQCLKNELDPPLPYEDNSFDVINAISVFTHLSLDMQFKWAWELYRVIKPSGYLHFTAHGPAFSIWRITALSMGACSTKLTMKKHAVSA